MTRHWFGTDGIRGLAGEGPLAAPFLRRLGRALAEQAVTEDGDAPIVLLARDTRESGPAISAALATGLAAGGARAVDLGVVPTPALPMAMRARGAARGVVVSASHNPWTDNGVKVFGAGGLKLTDAQEHALEARVRELGGESDDGRASDSPRIESVDGARGYVEALLERFSDVDLTGMRLAVDCAHGAATLTAPTVLTALGARVTPLFVSPDGRNINAGCGSTHLDALADVVRAGTFDLGIAFDGDADRVLMVDTAGRHCGGDHMLAFLGTHLASRDALPKRTVVATIMSNLGLERTLSGAGIALRRTKVGDRYVHAEMREGGYGLGGEASGHLLFGAEHHFNGDGLYTALKLLGGLRESGRDLASVIDAVPSVPQVLLNVQVAAKPPLESLPALGERVAAAEAAHGADVRIVLRYSGTENLARVMVEGVDADVVHGLADELAALWRRAVSGQGSRT
ncbi:MAG: phosphoglucosamine mutase [Planctomycetes bacterium]|nr:phosphoglucosamine mutase [Planctomycetota bacterium]